MAEIDFRMIVPGPRVDGESARTAAGLDPDQFQLVCRAAGYPVDGPFTELDIRALSTFGRASAFFSEAELEPLVRVLRSLMGHLADALTALFRIDVAAPMAEAGAAPVEFARKNLETAQLLKTIPTTMEAFLMHQLREAIARSDQSRQNHETSSSTTVKVAVGFVDIVGYTPIADRLEPDDLGRFVLEFERRATDTVVAGGGRVVKLIGDEVMFVVVDADAAFTIAQRLVDAFADTDATPRGGVLFGELVSRGGDYYGRLVNMASRLADLAVPGEILTDVDTARGATRHRFEAAGRRMLKGFAEPVELRSLADGRPG